MKLLATYQVLLTVLLIQFFFARNSSMEATPNWFARKASEEKGGSENVSPNSISSKGYEEKEGSGKAAPRWFS